MDPQKTIHAVLVRRTPTPARPKFTFHAHTLPTSALHPGTFSPPLPFISPLFPPGRSLRIHYTHTHTPTTITTTTSAHLPLDFAPFLFGYFSSNLLQHPALTSALIFFREDLRPLQPAQCRLLWAYCECLVRGVYAEVLVAWPWGGGWREVVAWMEALWRGWARLDGWYAWAGRYRNEKLLKGREEWRGVALWNDEGPAVDRPAWRGI